MKKNVSQVLPKYDKELIKVALIQYQNSISSLIDFYTREGNQVMVDQLHHTHFDLHSLIGMMNYDVTINLPQEERDAFAFKHGVDFPDYDGHRCQLEYPVEQDSELAERAKINNEAVDAEAEVKNELKELVESSELFVPNGNKYIPVNVFGYTRLELNEELIFVDKNDVTYSIDNGDLKLIDFQDIICHEIVRRESKKTQYALSQEMLSATGINMVTCGDCGEVNIHRVDEEDITCASCGTTSEPCDFPDFFIG